VSKEQKTFTGISDPENCRKLNEPVAIEHAEKALNEFFEEFYDLRNKHGIANAYCIVQMNVLADDGSEGEVITSMHAGNELVKESLAAWALGKEQANRQQRIAKLLADSPAVRTPQSRK
jgi:hypothetical protein